MQDGGAYPTDCAALQADACTRACSMLDCMKCVLKVQRRGRGAATLKPAALPLLVMTPDAARAVPAPAVVMSAVRYRWPRGGSCLAIDELVLARVSASLYAAPAAAAKTPCCPGGRSHPAAGGDGHGAVRRSIVCRPARAIVFGRITSASCFRCSTCCLICRHATTSCSPAVSRRRAVRG